MLDEILAHKREEVAAVQQAVPLAEVRARALAAPPPRDFAAAIAGPPVRVIAEVKRASPSAGPIRTDSDPVEVARAYVEAGASALSVLTDRRYFQGSPSDLRRVREAVTLPVLRKDFIVDSYQVYEARALGADAVLLIAAAIPATELAALGDLAHEIGLAAVFEVHEEHEIATALAAGATIIGINNRDLRTLAVDLDTTRRLRPRIPSGLRVISESGIETPADVRRVAAVGIDAILVGTALMASADPAAHLVGLRRAAQEAAARAAVTEPRPEAGMRASPSAQGGPRR